MSPTPVLPVANATNSDLIIPRAKASDPANSTSPQASNTTKSNKVNTAAPLKAKSAPTKSIKTKTNLKQPVQKKPTVNAATNHDQLSMKQSATSGAPKGVSVTTDAVAVLKQTVLKQPVQAEPTSNTETNQDPPSTQHLATSGAPKGATVTRNAGPALKPTPRRHRRQASNSPATKKRCMQVDAMGVALNGDNIVVFKAKKQYDGKPAYMMDLANSLEEVKEPYIVGIYNVNSGVPYDKAAVVMLDVQDGEDPASAIERQGVAFAKALEDYTKPYKNGNTVGLTTSCTYAYTENENEPQFLNAVVGDRNAARVVADIYQDHIRDGIFWEAADDIIAQYFDESIDHKIAAKMVRHAARIFMD